MKVRRRLRRRLTDPTDEAMARVNVQMEVSVTMGTIERQRSRRARLKGKNFAFIRLDIVALSESL